MNSYTLSHREIITGERKYVWKIRDMRPEDKPREKMMSLGVTSLSVAELMAIVLGTGTKKEEIMQMSSRIVRDYGDKMMLNYKNPEILAKEFDIPIGKAAQIIACIELGKRFFQRNDSFAPILRSGKEVFEYAREMGSLTKEHLRGIYLNVDYKVIHDETISIGTLDANIIHPREVLKPAIEYSAAGIILIHNHPSGNIEPSAQDLEVTNQLVEAGKIVGIDIIDHIIITRNAYKSIKTTY